MSLQLDPATVIEEGDLWTIALNRNQSLLGSTMVVLERSCTDVASLNQKEWSALHPRIQRVVVAVGSLFEPDRFNFAFLMNYEPQVHLHVLPRYAASRSWKNHEFTDLDWGRPHSHYQRSLDPQDLAELASEIQSALPKPT